MLRHTTNLFVKEVKIPLGNCISNLRIIVETHFYKGSCSQKEKDFLLSNICNYGIPHFYIIWNILKNQPVGQPIVAGDNWILTPASILLWGFSKRILKIPLYSKWQYMCLIKSVSAWRITFSQVWKPTASFDLTFRKTSKSSQN